MPIVIKELDPKTGKPKSKAKKKKNPPQVAKGGGMMKKKGMRRGGMMKSKGMAAGGKLKMVEKMERKFHSLLLTVRAKWLLVVA